MNTPITCSCIICRQIVAARGIHSHHFHKHDENGKSIMENIRKKGTKNSFANKEFQEKHNQSRNKIKTFKKCGCDGCNTQITGKKKYCSQSCAAIQNNKSRSSESIEKQKQSFRKARESIHTVPKPPKIKIPTVRVCDVCGKREETFSNRGFQSTTCANCANTNAYRSKCTFKFDIRKFPDEFNIQLIIDHGMFHPVKNPYGAVKDHLLSIKFGKDNNIDPKIMAHPANCQIILQRDNMKKLSKCHHSLDELLQKIKEWDLKYS